jgi:hypothetical protein
MPKNTPAEEAQEAPLDLQGEPSPYDVPSELDEATIADERGDEPPAHPRRPAALKLAIGVALVLLVGAALLAYRAHHRRKVVAEGLAKAGALLRLDTAAGYRAAASLLEPLAELDPTEAGSVRAFALAMLFADYGEAGREAEAEALLVGPARAEVVPSHAHLATAALALGRREAGTATTALARAGELPWARALQARVAFLAGNLPAALEPAAAAAADGGFAPGLALRGDALRRLRQDPAGARAAYEAALAASPVHPRAAYGLAKLALSGHAPAAGAAAALERVAGDRDGTPGAERARAALHLAALRLRSGDRAGADAILDGAGLGGPARAWAERAAAVEAENRGAYRAVSGAPAALQSASDDDPPELSPNPPPPPPKAEAKPSKAAKKAAAKPAKRASAKKATPKKAPQKKPAAKKPPARRTATRR